jgi:uncharacterized protein (DUF488 family)
MSGRLERVATIGVYGWTAASFFESVERESDLVVDIRARRGVRGAEYSFANSRRLQDVLSSRGIAYLHLPEFAPPKALRGVQIAADREARTTKRVRDTLAAGFRTGYQSQVLARIDLGAAVEEMESFGSRPVLLCVERSADACHRSIVAEALVAAASVAVKDLEP